MIFDALASSAAGGGLSGRSCAIRLFTTGVYGAAGSTAGEATIPRGSLTGRLYGSLLFGWPDPESWPAARATLAGPARAAPAGDAEAAGSTMATAAAAAITRILRYRR